MEHGGDVKYFLWDHLGSTSGLADQNGSLASSVTYDSFGNEIAGSVDTRYRFTGREKDDETGLYYYRARWYDPTAGRFVSEDPIGFDGGDVNLYAYVGNNPQNFTDPSGLNPLTCAMSPGGIGTNGCGNDFAGELEAGIDALEEFLGFDPIFSVGINYDFSSFSSRPINAVGLFGMLRGIAGMFRVGSGIGYAIFCEDNIWGKLAYIAMDVERAAGLFTAMAGPLAGKFGGGSVGNLKGPRINPQKQAGHVPGTPQNANRIKQGKPTSSFFGEESGNLLTQEAFAKGKPVPGRPNVVEHDFGVSVGTGPNGGMQTRVRVHQNSKGEIHGHPSGPERY